MKRYSVVLLDIDGTLLDSRNEISHNTKTLLNRLTKKGVPIVFCSERMPGGVELVARQTEVRAPVICYSGSLILDEKRSILADEGIEAHVALAFKEFVNRQFPEISLNSYIYDIWFVDDKEDKETRRLAELTQAEALEFDLASAVRNTKHIHKFLCAGASRNVQALREAAEKEFPLLDFTLSSSIYLEVTKKGVSKRTAMDAIRRYYHIGAEQIVAVGDYYVDIELLQAAGLGIAMGNAPESVKRAANRVTADNDEEGVYIALKNLRFQVPENKTSSPA